MTVDRVPSKNKLRQEKSRRKGLKVLGICLGASTVSMVQAAYHPAAGERGGNTLKSAVQIIDFSSHAHEGNPKHTLLKALKTLDIGSFDKIVATGRRFRRFVNLTSIPEPEAVELAYLFVRQEHIDCSAIVSAGGETFMVYTLDSSGRIINVVTGNKCASGTGEFFLQQLRRMDVPLEEAARWAAVETPYQVSGRCSVFCKSDCTHATNKGVPKSKVTAGLCKMMADKVLELLKNVEKRHIMLTGGTTHNRMMVSYLKEAISDLIIPEAAPCFEALGAALWGCENETNAFPGFENLFSTDAASFERLSTIKSSDSMVTFKSLENPVLYKA